MKRLVVGGLVLWLVALSTSGVVLAGTVAPDATAAAGEDAAATVEDGVVTVTGFGGDVWVRLTNESVSARATAGETVVGLEALGTDDASGSLSSPALGDSTAAAASGLCAVGLSDEDAPARFEVADEDRVEVAFGVYTGPESDRPAATEVASACAR
jgi:hypothetical protein